MSRLRLRWLWIVLLTVLCPANAAPPSTLAYQGSLAGPGGNPITGSLNITFRLYDQPSGGLALWSETQAAVDVDGGNLIVELGGSTPLPRSVWGRQLYLGVQIAGDSEMLPRPALTASPYALRAGGTMRRTLVVSAEGTPAQNGAALLARVASISDASASSPVAVELDAGIFDLGSQQLVMPEFTTLRGRGPESVITSSFTVGSAIGGSATLQLSSNTAARDLMAINTGVPAGDPAISVWGINASDPLAVETLAQNVSLERVVGEASAAVGEFGQRAGIRLCASNSRATQVTGRSFGGQFNMGLRADCAMTSNLVIDGAVVESAQASDGARAAYFVAGPGNVWQGIEARVDISSTAQSAYGIRFLTPGSFFAAGPAGQLADSTIRLVGNPAAAAAATTISGVQTDDGAQLAAMQRVDVVLDGVRGGRVSGLYLRDQSSNTPALAGLLVQDSTVLVTGVQDSALGSFDLFGIRIEGFAPQLSNVTVKVHCLAGSSLGCIAAGQSQGAALLAGAEPLKVDRSQFLATHAAPAANGIGVALQLKSSAQIRATQLRVVRGTTEPVTAVNLIDPAARISIVGSGVVATDSANANTLCLLAGPAGASGELLGSQVQGSRCDGGQVSLSCAGNTARGSGFLASTCP